MAFALGNPRALVYHEDDMMQPLRENLPATLAALRATVDELSPGALEGTAYTHWLEALRAVSRPQLDETLPRVLRTAAWQDRKLEAVLASWAELRHDTILAVEQSVGGEGCQYPHGYVDPMPELYRSLSRSAAALAPLFTALAEGDLPSASYFENVPAFLTCFQETMERLATMAEKELVGHPGLLVIALERGDGVVLYGGPVASFYGFHQPLSEGRLTDEQWRARVQGATLPPRPAFARAYWVE